MYGAIIGDVVGSKFEFDRGNKSKEFELFTKEDCFTDDTVMTVAVAEALMDAGKDASEAEVKAHLISSMKKWGKEYPYAGYGARFIHWVLTDDPEPYGSFGNGSGMRVSAAGWLYDTIERTREVARWTAEVTHNHPEGIKGAESVAAAIFLARNGSEKDEIEKYIIDEFGYDLSRTLDEIRPDYYHVEVCMKTMPEAFECFLEGESYEDTLRNVAYIGGDTDTLGAIAGAIAEAFWGIPIGIQVKGKEYLENDMLSVVDRFYRMIHVTVQDYDDEYVKNQRIKECVARAKLSHREEDAVNLLAELRNRIAEDGEAPAPMVDVDNVMAKLNVDDMILGKKITMPEGLRLHFDKMQDGLGEQWIPLFTDMEELQKQPTTNININMPIRTILEEGIIDKTVCGVVINPFGDSMPLPKEILKIILNTKEKK